MYPNFIEFMKSVVLPRQAANPDHIRLDGARSGGNFDEAGRFQHRGQTRGVAEDSHYEPLKIALEAAEAGIDPFAEEPTKTGTCLVLKPELTAKYDSPHKHIYIYSKSS